MTETGLLENSPHLAAMRKIGRALTAFVLLIAVFAKAVGAEPPPTPASATSQAMSPSTTSAAARVTEYQLPPEKLKQAEQLDRIRKVLYVGRTLYGIAGLLLLLQLRMGARLRTWAEALSQRRFAQAVVVVPPLLLTLGFLNLPLGIYRHHLQVAYGFSVQGWASWFGDWVKAELVNIVVLLPVAWGFFEILRRWPRRWWLCAWAGVMPLVLLGVFLHPLLIDPLFNKFDPLEARQPALVEQIEKIVRRGGLEIPRSRMFEMRASEKVTTYNAYVTGVGASKRVVVWDTTARELTVPQTLFIFGHEQGHYVLNHVWKGLGGAAVGLLIGFYLAQRVMGVLLAKWGHRWGILSLSDWASLPLFLLLVSGFEFASQPLESGFSRYLEHQADIYALEVAYGLIPDSSQVGAQSFQRLGEKGLAIPNPDPLFVFWTYSHPPVGDRIRFALDYQPWRAGQAPRYVK